jgi:hypothetical protein
MTTKDGLEVVPRKVLEDKKKTKEDAFKAREARRERDNELITGIFRYIERPGNALRFRFKKYAGDDYKQYKLIDGERYKLPRMVARHLNKDVYYMKYKHIPGFGGMQGGVAPEGNRFNDGLYTSDKGMHFQEKVHRCEFRSLEFSDEDLDASPPNITMVTAYR